MLLELRGHAGEKHAMFAESRNHLPRYGKTRGDVAQLRRRQMGKRVWNTGGLCMRLPRLVDKSVVGFGKIMVAGHACEFARQIDQFAGKLRIGMQIAFERGPILARFDRKGVEHVVS